MQTGSEICDNLYIILFSWEERIYEFYRELPGVEQILSAGHPKPSYTDNNMGLM